jgi:hypothetical protein
MTSEAEEKKNRAAQALGRKGGKSGVGASKKRGDSEFYRQLRARQVVKSGEVVEKKVEV